MEGEGETNDDFLPDLPDEISGEQLVLQQCVFRANEVFVKKHNDILKWLNSPSEFRVYPSDACQNKHAYKKKASLYSYDKRKGILFKTIKNADGIGKFTFHLVYHVNVCEKLDCKTEIIICYIL